MQHQHETMNGKIYKSFYDVGAYLSPDAYKCENVKNCDLESGTMCYNTRSYEKTVSHYIRYLYTF